MSDYFSKGVKNLQGAVRTLVSQDRTRTQHGELDLDMSYITDRIIAIALPSTGYATVLRNSEDEYSKYFNDVHGNHYRIWNTSQLSYDYSKFNNSVVDVGWPDHHNPSVVTAFYMCAGMLKWLCEDPENVVIVHCLAGKGRTGCIIACLLLYMGKFHKAQQALLHFAERRVDVRNKKSAAGDGSDMGGGKES